MDQKHSEEIFSFHLVKIPFFKKIALLFTPLHKRKVPGLLHSEFFFTMNLGEPVMSLQRYNLSTMAFFAWWSDESKLENFLQQSQHSYLSQGWHVRMKLYRRWGEVADIKQAFVDPTLSIPDKTVVAVTLARLNILETFRFIKWGKPVERQVRDHKGQTLALAAIRPPNTFSTFSIWKNEAEMLNMVSGRHKQQDGESHKLAMQERNRKDFHFEFTTMRFTPLKEYGNLILKKPEA